MAVTRNAKGKFVKKTEVVETPEVEAPVVHSPAPGETHINAYHAAVADAEVGVSKANAVLSAAQSALEAKLNEIKGA